MIKATIQLEEGTRCWACDVPIQDGDQIKYVPWASEPFEHLKCP